MPQLAFPFSTVCLCEAGDNMSQLPNLQKKVSNLSLCLFSVSGTFRLPHLIPNDQLVGSNLNEQVVSVHSCTEISEEMPHLHGKMQEKVLGAKRTQPSV